MEQKDNKSMQKNNTDTVSDNEESSISLASTVEKKGDGGAGAPSDKGHLVYLIQMLYGMAILLPFNVVMSCTDFYEDKVSKQMRKTFLICSILFADANFLPS